MGHCTAVLPGSRAMVSRASSGRPFVPVTRPASVFWPGPELPVAGRRTGQSAGSASSVRNPSAPSSRIVAMLRAMMPSGSG